MSLFLTQLTGIVCTPSTTFSCGEIKSWHILKMPRPRKTPGQLAAKNGERPRLFSIVIHDVDFKIAKSRVFSKVSELKSDWFLIAEEPYTHQDGQHLHVFLKYVHPKAKSTVLDWIQKMNLGGRVQVDYGRSDFNKCKKYLTEPDKDKPCDPSPIINVTKLTLQEKYPEHCHSCLICGVKCYDPPIFIGHSYVQSGSCVACARQRISKLYKGPPLGLPAEPPE